MRGCLRVFIVILGLFVVPLVGCMTMAGGLIANNNGPTTPAQNAQIVISIVITIALFVAVFIWSEKAGRIDMSAWLGQHSQCPYSAAWDGCGIALDPAARALHLAAKTSGRSITKSYAFADVREWGFDMPGSANVTAPTMSGGGTYAILHNTNEGLGAAAKSIASVDEAIENTGLWVSVRDVEHPRWFVKFRAKQVQDKATEAELRRWMEILRQQINEGGGTSR